MKTNYQILILLIFIFGFGYSQNSLKIEYVKEIKPDINYNEFNSTKKKYVNKLIDDLDKYKYNLYIDLSTNVSLFKSNFSMSVDGQKKIDRQLLNILDGRFSIYNSKKADSTYQHISMSGSKEFLVRYSVNKFNWKLIDSSRVINGIECKLASGFYETPNLFDSSMKRIKYFAWYAPKLPSNYGPAFFTGLPGLVVIGGNELVQYRLINIKNESKLKFVIPKLNSINEYQLLNRMKSIMDIKN